MHCLYDTASECNYCIWQEVRETLQGSFWPAMMVLCLVCGISTLNDRRLHYIVYPSVCPLTLSDNFPFHFEIVQAPRNHHGERGGHPSCCHDHGGVHAADHPSPFHCRPPLPLPHLRAPYQLPALHGESCQPHQVLRWRSGHFKCLRGHPVILVPF